MMIPSANLTLGPVVFGQTARASNAQFGNVELHSDGLVDEHVKNSKVRDLGCPDLRNALTLGAQVARNSLTAARQNFEDAVKVDSHTLSRQHQEAIENGLGQLPASVYVTTDHRGVMTQAKLHLHSEKGRYDNTQFVTLSADKAVIETRGQDALHTITVGFLADGSLDLSNSQEQLTLTTPWLPSASTSDVRASGITKIDDPRLERIAGAAGAGFFLNPNELGQDWRCQTEGNRQIFTNFNEKLVLDADERSFTLAAVSSHTGHAGSGDDVGTDYDVTGSVKWLNGKLYRTSYR